MLLDGGLWIVFHLVNLILGGVFFVGFLLFHWFSVLY